MSPACSLVRGTRTRQPKSGRLSHQDSLARLSTAEPTVTTTGPVRVSSPADFSATADSLPATLLCAVPVPSTVTTTGVLPGRPPSTSAAAAVGSCSAPACSTSGLPVPPAAAARAVRSTVVSTERRSAWIEEAPSGTPAYAGTAVPTATPGTTSDQTLLRVTASASFTTASSVNGSPATSRTTVLPFLAVPTAAFELSAG